jgi:imidazolonepropionase-like amidohydrolase
MLAELGLFDNLELLHAWAVETPRRIFPNRRIGALEAGFEASFLALDGNPLDDISNAHRISLRVKKGRLLFPREIPFP